MDKLKPSTCFSCCFRGSVDDDVDSLPLDDDTHRPSSLIHSPAWIRSKAQDLTDIKGKCRGFVSRIRRCGNNGRRRHHHSVDFRYDPFSYALNFDEGPVFDDDGEISPAGYRYRSFSSRLPPSPTKQAAIQKKAAAAAIQKKAAAAAAAVVPSKETMCT